MHTPGITVKPLIDMSNGHHFNEVYFENVRVPRSGLLGELNRGWYMAATTLSYERSGIEGPAAAARYVRLLTQYARRRNATASPWRKIRSCGNVWANWRPRWRWDGRWPGVSLRSRPGAIFLGRRRRP